MPRRPAPTRPTSSRTHGEPSSPCATTAGDGTSATAALQVIVDGRPPQARVHVQGSRLAVDAADDLQRRHLVTVALSGAAPFKPAVPADGVRARRRALRAPRAGAGPGRQRQRHTGRRAASTPGRRPCASPCSASKGAKLRVRITAADVGSASASSASTSSRSEPAGCRWLFLRPGAQHLLIATDVYGDVRRAWRPACRRRLESSGHGNSDARALTCAIYRFGYILAVHGVERRHLGAARSPLPSGRAAGMT